MTARELRQKYLAFFESKGHTIYPSGSLVPIDVTGKLDESLLFNGAGMVQFKPFFRGSAQPPNKRLTTAQKCVRTGDIEVVGDPTHLTFFEMLGNFSFGDYFKSEAIAFSWEFLTSKEWLGLDPNRLSFTVFQEDDVAEAEWMRILTNAGIDAKNRVFRLGEETNYWPAGSFTSGPPGPCGPNSEMFYWARNDVPPPSGPYTVEDWLKDDAAGNWVEIWNDVFIQYEWKGHLKNPDRPNEGYVKEGLDDLPFQSIDTGMGLDRTVMVLNGFTSVYSTDLFQPILKRIVENCDALPESWQNGDASAIAAVDEGPEGRAARIIADHIRTACFCIADGILPGNSGRGYVLRRLIRRAVLKGLRVLKFDKPFFHLIYDGVVESMGDHYTELVERRATIVETLSSEEALFRRTLHSGSEKFYEVASSVKDGKFPGDEAFKLYDTYGFPIEVTRELSEEAGLTIDEEGYELALKRAQDVSRGASAMDNVYGGVTGPLLVVASPKATTQSIFVGYTHFETETEIVQISPMFDENGLTNGEFQISLGVTPFYAESGGQVGDTGIIRSIGRNDFLFKVTNTWKELGLIWCEATLESPEDWVGITPEEASNRLQTGFFFEPVIATVDAARRRRITRNHSATHLLHAALRHVLGPHVTQAGSLVSPDHLRFDFNHGKAMTLEEKEEVERLVNEAILGSTPVIIHENVPISEAKKAGAMALFGEKYGDYVRVVEMPNLSIELCGGCHVNSTSDIGMFFLIHEGSASSGVRRIEAITGERAYQYVKEQTQTLDQVANLLKSNANDVVLSVEKTLEALKEERKKREKAEVALIKGASQTTESSPTETVGSVNLWTNAYRDVDPKIAAQEVDNRVAQDANLVAVIGIASEGRINFIAKVGASALEKGAHAGNILREIAKIAGGGGGGRPDFATAGGKNVDKLEEAIASAKTVLASQLKA